MPRKKKWENVQNGTKVFVKTVKSGRKTKPNLNINIVDIDTRKYQWEWGTKISNDKVVLDRKRENGEEIFFGKPKENSWHLDENFKHKKE